MFCFILYRAQGLFFFLLNSIIVQNSIGFYNVFVKLCHCLRFLSDVTLLAYALSTGFNIIQHSIFNLILDVGAFVLFACKA